MSQCHGKEQLTKAEAKRAVRQSRRNLRTRKSSGSGRPVRLDAHKCPRCQHWHVGVEGERT